MVDKKIVDINSHKTYQHNHPNRYKSHSNNRQKKKRKNNNKFYYIIAALAACLVFCIWTILKDDDSINSPTVIPVDSENNNPNNDQQDLFTINNFTITDIDNKDLWSEINFTFTFAGSPDLEQYRDSRGLLLISCYAEYYNQEGAFEISQTYNITISNDNTYSGNITCLDSTLTIDRISAIVFNVNGFNGSHTVRVNFE